MTRKIYPTIGHELVFNSERKFVQAFGVGFTVNLWMRNSTTVKLLHTLYKSKNHKSIELNWYCDNEKDCKWHWDFEDGKFTRSYITPLDEFQCSIQKIYWCRNNGCWRQYKCLSEQKAHLETCRFRPKEKVITFKQRRMDANDEGESLLNDLGFCHISKEFVCYDIECVTIDSKDDDGINPQRICSIGCRASWKSKGKIFHRRDSNPSSAMILIKQFCGYLHELQKEYEDQLPLAEISEKMNSLDKLNFATEFEKKKAHTVIDNIKRLKVLAFNGERYDAIQLYAFLVVIFGERNEETSVIKRGSGIMSFASEKLIFLDAINFVGGMSLKQFGTNYAGIEIEKGIFPHRTFQSIEEMRKCVKFPAYDEFKSDLNPPNDDDLKKNYEEYRKYKSDLYTEFEEDLFSAIPPDGFHTSVNQYLLNLKEFETNILNNEWKSFVDYMSKYCLIDVDVLMLGMKKYIDEFIKEFKISPIDSISMPALAAKIMWRSYAKSAPSIFSFNQKYGFLNEEIRKKALLGGYVGTFITEINFQGHRILKVFISVT